MIMMVATWDSMDIQCHKNGCLVWMDHEVVLCHMAFSMVRLHDYTSMVRIIKKCKILSLLALSRCKPNVDQEE